MPNRKETRERDPGPMARLEGVKADRYSLGVIVQRVAAGESIKDLARQWQIPHKAFSSWVRDQGLALVNKARMSCASRPAAADSLKRAGASKPEPEGDDGCI